MKNFFRAVRLACSYRFTFAGIVACSLLVAVFWGANITAVYPFIEVVFRGDSMHQWVDNRVAESQTRIAEVEQEIERLNGRRPAGPEEQQKLALAISYQKSRLYAEQRTLSTLGALQPSIKRYLPNDPFQTLCLIALFIMVATLLKDIFLVANNILVTRLGERVTLDLRAMYYEKILDLDLRGFGQNNGGAWLSRVVNEVQAVTGGVTVLLGKCLREPLKMAVCITGAAFISWRLLVVSMLVAPLALFLLSRLAKSIKRASTRKLEEVAQLQNRLSESLAAFQEVKAFTMERFELDRFQRAAMRVYRRVMKLATYGAFITPNNELLGVGVICFGLLSGGYLVIHQETHLLGVKITDQPLSFGALMLFYGFLIGVADPGRKLSSVFSTLQGAAAAADRVFDVLDSKPAITDPPNPRPLPARPWDLELEQVNFSYVDSQPVLRDVNLRIREGETLAVVGPNGCGKSTLINLLLRFYDPNSGKVTLGGVDLRELKLHDLRSQIGLVTQQTLLFDDSVADNIRYGSPDATREQVMEAARRAHAHRFILDVLEDGYDTKAGQHGRRLSGGQRQRVAMARAILRDPAILILDEATSQIDPESEQLIHRALEEFARSRTAILITHRMTTLDLADRILVMDAGRVVDVGSHEELIGRCATYSRLYQTRFKDVA